MAWLSSSDTPIEEITGATIERMRRKVESMDVNKLSVDELRQYFEFSRRLLNSKVLTNDDRFSVEPTKSQQKDTSHLEEKSQLGGKTDGIEESYYIQTIQELNREIAQNVYNKPFTDENDGNAAAPGVDDSSQSLGIDTKKDLLYKIHLKNKYIKRLLCEHGALIETNNRQRDEILMLNVSLKQSAHKLAEALTELVEQKELNRDSAADIARLHKKIYDVRRQMARIEHDKRQYKNDISCLGAEIQKKIDQWNGMLQTKCTNIGDADAESARTHCTETAAAPSEIAHGSDINRMEVEALSKAVKKRNKIIVEMEVLLTGLTNEISSSAIVINRIVKNLSQKENNFADHLEKLHKHLERIVTKPPSDSGDSRTKKPKKTKGGRPPIADDNNTKSKSKNKAQIKDKLLNSLQSATN